MRGSPRLNVLVAAGNTQTSSFFKDSSKRRPVVGRSDTVKTCHHYTRHCQIKCGECNKFFACKFCHDLQCFKKLILKRI